MYIFINILIIAILFSAFSQAKTAFCGMFFKFKHIDSHVTLYRGANYKRYSSLNPMSPVTMVAHTHRASGDPSGKDIPNMVPGVINAIYYSGYFDYYR